MDGTAKLNAETSNDVSIELSSKVFKTTRPAFFNLLTFANGFYNTKTSTLICSNSELTITNDGQGNF